MFIKPNMLLAEPVQIPEEYRETVEEFLVQWWNNRHWEMANEWGFQQIAPLAKTDVIRTFLAERVAQIANYAAGGDEPRDYVLDNIQTICERLFAVSAGVYEIPAVFWQSPFGWMLLTAQIRAQGDELMTISDAAEATGLDVRRISDMARRGKLTSYRDPSEKNPRRATRLLKSEVEALREG